MRTSHAVDDDGRRFSGMVPRATILMTYSMATHAVARVEGSVINLMGA